MATPETFAVGAQIDKTSVAAGVFRLSDHAEFDAHPLSIDRSSTAHERLSQVIEQVRRGSQFFGVKPDVIGVALPASFKDLHRPNLTSYLDMMAHLPSFSVDEDQAFGLGVHAGLFPNEQRLMTITVGEKLGSAFIVGGESAEEDDIGSISYYGHSLEDSASAQGVVKSYNNAVSKAYRHSNVEDVEELAKNVKGAGNHSLARNAYRTLGYDLALGLSDTIQAFEPTRIVFGGSLSEASYDLFAPEFDARLRKIEGLKDHDIQIVAAVDQNYTLMGAAAYARRQMLKAS